MQNIIETEPVEYRPNNDLSSCIDYYLFFHMYVVAIVRCEFLECVEVGEAN